MTEPVAPVEPATRLLPAPVNAFVMVRAAPPPPRLYDVPASVSVPEYVAFVEAPMARLGYPAKLIFSELLPVRAMAPALAGSILGSQLITLVEKPAASRYAPAEIVISEVEG